MATKLAIALTYAEHGFTIYPLVENTKVPIKGSHGFNSATLDTNYINSWWGRHNYNFGLALQPSHLLVFDIDRQHNNNVDGLANFNRLEKERGYSLPLDTTYIEKTPRGGLHIFMSYPENAVLHNVTGAFFPDSGLDIITTGVPVAPTKIGSGYYLPLQDKKLNMIAPAPDWLLEYLTTNSNQTPADKPTYRKLTYAGRLLNDIIAGADKGNRNTYLTRLCGRLLSTGASSNTAYEMLMMANERLQQPLSDQELNKIFKSILRREIAR